MCRLPAARQRMLFAQSPSLGARHAARTTLHMKTSMGRMVVSALPLPLPVV